jgi:hypothetical protein
VVEALRNRGACQKILISFSFSTRVRSRVKVDEYSYADCRRERGRRPAERAAR